MEQDKEFENSIEENINEASNENNQEIEILQPEILKEENNDSFNDEAKEESEELITVRPVKFQEFEESEPNRSIKKNLDILQDVSMHISVELGKTKATIKDVMDYKEGSIVELDKIAGEQVEVYANNKLIAKGEVIVIEDKFGVRVTSTNLPKAIQ